MNSKRLQPPVAEAQKQQKELKFIFIPENKAISSLFRRTIILVRNRGIHSSIKPTKPTLNTIWVDPNRFFYKLTCNRIEKMLSDLNELNMSFEYF